jgi:hypothetical protein
LVDPYFTALVIIVVVVAAAVAILKIALKTKIPVRAMHPVIPADLVYGDFIRS